MSVLTVKLDHRYERNGTFTLVVVVTTVEGLAYPLNVSNLSVRVAAATTSQAPAKLSAVALVLLVAAAACISTLVDL